MHRAIEEDTSTEDDNDTMMVDTQRNPIFPEANIRDF